MLLLQIFQLASEKTFNHDLLNKQKQNKSIWLI